MTVTYECSVTGCSNPSESRGMCGMHYLRWKRTGRTTRQGRQTHAEVATAAKADAVVRLFALRLIPAEVPPERVAEAVGLSVADLRAAVARRDGSAGEDAPKADRRRMNRKAPPGLKWCNRCRRFLPFDQFSRNRFSSDGRQGWCAPCTRIYQRRWQRSKAS